MVVVGDNNDNEVEDEDDEETKWGGVCSDVFSSVGCEGGGL